MPVLLLQLFVAVAVSDVAPPGADAAVMLVMVLLC